MRENQFHRQTTAKSPARPDCIDVNVDALPTYNFSLRGHRFPGAKRWRYKTATSRSILAIVRNTAQPQTTEASYRPISEEGDGYSRLIRIRRRCLVYTCTRHVRLHTFPTLMQHWRHLMKKEKKKQIQKGNTRQIRPIAPRWKRLVFQNFPFNAAECGSIRLFSREKSSLRSIRGCIVDVSIFRE